MNILIPVQTDGLDIQAILGWVLIFQQPVQVQQRQPVQVPVPVQLVPVQVQQRQQVQVPVRQRHYNYERYTLSITNSKTDSTI